MSAWGKLSSAARRRPLLTAGLALAALLVLFVVAGYAALQAPVGREALARYVERLLSIPGERAVAIGRIEGRLPQRLRIERLEVADRDGVWLVMEDIRVDWRPLALIRGTLAVDSLTVERTVASRRPATGGGEGGEFGGFALPVDVAFDLVAFRSLSLDRAVLGEPATLRLEANATLADGVAEVALAADRVDGREGAANLWLSWDAPSGVLDLEATLSEPPGGLLARLARLPGYPALELEIGGEGPAGAWEGSLEANAESLISLHSRIAVALDETLRIGIEGSAAAGPALPDAARMAMQPRADFAADLVRQGDGDAIAVTVSRLESGSFRARGAATIVPGEGRISGSAALDVLDASFLSALVAPVAFDGGSTEIAFDGPIANPAFDVRGRIAAFAVDTVRSEELTLDLRLAPDLPFGDPAQTVAIAGQLAASGFASGIEAIRALLGPAPSAEFETRLAVAQRRLDFTRLHVAGAGGAMTAKGGIDLEPMRVEAEGDIDLPELSRLSGLAGRPLAGAGRAGFSVSWARGGGLDLRLSGSVEDPKLDVAAVEALLGPQARFSGDLSLAPDGALTATSLRVAGRAVEATGGLTMPAGRDDISADYTAVVTDLSPFGLADGSGGAGRLELSGKANGAPGDPVVTGAARFESIAVGGVAFDRLAVEYDVASVISRPAGDIRIQGTGPLLPDLSGTVAFARDGDLIRIGEIAATARGTRVGGNVAISLTGAPAAGRLDVSVSDLGRWSDVAGLRLAGSADASVDLAADKERQVVKLTGTGRNIAAGPDASAELIEFGAALADPAADGRIAANATLRRAQFPGTTLTDMTLTYDGTIREADLSLRAAGDLRGKFDLSAEARLRREQDAVQLTVTRLEGEAAGAPIGLRRPTTITLGARTELSDLAVDFGGGHLALDFRMTADQAVLDARATAIPLRIVAPDLPPQFAAGVADAEIAISGRPSNPAGRFTLSITGLAPSEVAIAPGGFSLRFEGTLRDQVLAVNGRSAGVESVDLNLDASVPVRAAISPPAFGLVDSRPAKGAVVYRGPIEPAWALAGIDIHRLSGRADMDLRFSGTLEDPIIDGSVALAGGRYENLDTGTVLSEMDILARPSISAIVIERATARDGADGHVSASGRLDFSTANDMTIDLAAQFREATLIRRDELVAELSGNVALTGGTADRLLSGRLEVNEAEIRLVGGLPASVVEIDVIEKGAERKVEEAAPPPASSRTRLDLTIDMPRRVFVRGRGLDSEWGGRLQIGGTTATPRVEGELRPLRGRYDFVGKSFTLQEGQINFTGTDEINPLLDLSAARSSGDLTAIIRVTGTARRPQVRMESRPALPQDEVLSRILFNKSTGRLSASEAIRLSMAVATLSGASDGGGFFDFVRGMLNLDVLRIGGGDGEEDGAAQAGKYLSDRVFLGVEAGASAGSSGATVEVEITPNLKIEGDLSGDEKGEIGIKWKRDY